MTEYSRHGSTASRRSPSSSVPPTASPAASQQPNSAQHKRVYQACIPCRRRKVRCDLGSVDNPHDPPCVRCRRESKECFFSATRRKRKTDDGPDTDAYADEYIIRNGRKRLYTGAPSPTPDRRQYSEAPLVPRGSHVRREPLRRPEGARSTTSTGRASTSSHHSDFGAGTGDDSNAQLENIEAQTVMRQGVYGTHDALDLLYKAATDGFVLLPPLYSMVISRVC